jgi:hypothetical protein
MFDFLFNFFSLKEKNKEEFLEKRRKRDIHELSWKVLHFLEDKGVTVGEAIEVLDNVDTMLDDLHNALDAEFYHTSVANSKFMIEMCKGIRSATESL